MYISERKPKAPSLARELPNKGVWRERWAETQKFFAALHLDTRRDCSNPLTALDTQILLLDGLTQADAYYRSAFAFREGIRCRTKLQKASELGFKNCFYAQAVLPSATTSAVRFSIQKILEREPQKYNSLPKVYRDWKEERTRYRKCLERDFIGFRNWVFDLDSGNWDLNSLKQTLEKLDLLQFLAAIVETSPRKYHIYFRIGELITNPNWAGPDAHPLWPRQIGNRGAVPFSIWWNHPEPVGSRVKLFLGLWEGLNTILSGDPTIKDGLRRLQLPGFRNPKKPNLYSQLVYSNPGALALTPETLYQLHPEFLQPTTAPRARPTPAPAPTIELPGNFPQNPRPRESWEPNFLKRKFPRCHPPDDSDITDRFQYCLLRWSFIAQQVAGEEFEEFWKTVILPYFEARTFNSKGLSNWKSLAYKQYIRCLRSLGSASEFQMRSLEPPKLEPLPSHIQDLLRARGATEREIQRLTPDLHELLRRAREKGYLKYATGESYSIVQFPLKELRQRGFPGDLTAHRRLLSRLGLLVASYRYWPGHLTRTRGQCRDIEFSLERDFRHHLPEKVSPHPPLPPPELRLPAPLYRRFLDYIQGRPQKVSPFRELFPAIEKILDSDLTTPQGYLQSLIEPQYLGPISSRIVQNSGRPPQVTVSLFNPGTIQRFPWKWEMKPPSINPVPENLALPIAWKGTYTGSYTSKDWAVSSEERKSKENAHASGTLESVGTNGTLEYRTPGSLRRMGGASPKWFSLLISSNGENLCSLYPDLRGPSPPH